MTDNDLNYAIYEVIYGCDALMATQDSWRSLCGLDAYIDALVGPKT